MNVSNNLSVILLKIGQSNANEKSTQNILTEAKITRISAQRHNQFSVQFLIVQQVKFEPTVSANPTS